VTPEATREQRTRHAHTTASHFPYPKTLSRSRAEREKLPLCVKSVLLSIVYFKWQEFFSRMPEICARLCDARRFGAVLTPGEGAKLRYFQNT
jgi:hypothetical protein